MRIIRASKGGNLMFTCPECGNKTACCVDHDVHIPADVDYHDKFVCEECGAELYSEPQHNGEIKFKVGMENIESSTIPAKDIEVVAKAAADVRGYDDLLKVLSSLKLIDEGLWKDAQVAWSSKEYSPSALGKMISDELYWQYLADDVESCDSVNCGSEIDISDYTYVGNQDGYAIYRKIEKQADGSRKGVWVAQDQDEKNPPFQITYDQARGFEQIDDSSIKKLGKKLGNKLLPNSCARSDTEEYEDDYIDSSSEIDPEALANMESVVEAAKSVNIDSLKERIYKEAKKVMMSPEFGFPEDEVDDYLVVEVRDGDETTCVEVRAEVSYEGMSEMADRLNKIVQRYDPDAYFDHVTYGIIEAYIRKKSVQSSYMYPDFTCYRLEWLTNDGNRKRDEVYAFDSDDAKDKIRELYDNDVKQFMHVWKETRDSWIECASEVEGADYGGAYDIEPDQYFTKDDVMEFASLVTDELSSKIGVPFDIADAYMENPKLMSITVTDGESEFTTSIKIDMRKIYYPKDLMKFSKQAVEDIQSQYNAYYEDVTSATNSSNIQGGWNDVPDPPLDPPESDVYDLDNVDEYLEIEVDDEVVVNDDGSWDFVGDDPRPWALDGEDSHWSSETYTGIELTDATGLEENCMDLLESRIPGDPGNYKIHAKVTLCYIISGLQAEPPQFEEDDPEVYSDYAEVEFSIRDSKVEDFEFEEV